MPKIEGAYNCSYCHGDIDEACAACDPECDCIEIEVQAQDEKEAENFYKLTMKK